MTAGTRFQANGRWATVTGFAAVTRNGVTTVDETVVTVVEDGATVPETVFAHVVEACVRTPGWTWREHGIPPHRVDPSAPA
jgi:hypothetical protein